MRGKETSMCGCLSSAPNWGPGPQPGHVPDRESNWQHFGSQSGTQSTEPHQPGLKLFLNFSLWYILGTIGYSGTCCLISTYLWTFQFPFVIDFYFHATVVRKYQAYLISVFLNLLRLLFVAQHRIYPENIPYALEKNVLSAAIGWNALCVSVKSIWSNIHFKANVSLLTFCVMTHPLLKVGHIFSFLMITTSLGDRHYLHFMVGKTESRKVSKICPELPTSQWQSLALNQGGFEAKPLNMF